MKAARVQRIGFVWRGKLFGAPGVLLAALLSIDCGNAGNRPPEESPWNVPEAGIDPSGGGNNDASNDLTTRTDEGTLETGTHGLTSPDSSMPDANARADSPGAEGSAHPID